MSLSQTSHLSAAVAAAAAAVVAQQCYQTVHPSAVVAESSLTQKSRRFAVAGTSLLGQTSRLFAEVAWAVCSSFQTSLRFAGAAMLLLRLRTRIRLLVVGRSLRRQTKNQLLRAEMSPFQRALLQPPGPGSCYFHCAKTVCQNMYVSKTGDAIGRAVNGGMEKR